MGFEFFELTASAVISFSIYIYIYIYIEIRNKKHQQLTRKRLRSSSFTANRYESIIGFLSNHGYGNGLIHPIYTTFSNCKSYSTPTSPSPKEKKKMYIWSSSSGDIAKNVLVLFEVKPKALDYLSQKGCTY